MVGASETKVLKKIYRSSGRADLRGGMKRGGRDWGGTERERSVASAEGIG